MVRQIDTYYDKLFAAAVTVQTEHGSVRLQPHRTNNIMEQFFRDLKRSDRRTRAAGKFAPVLTTILADAPLFNNPMSDAWMEMILKRETTLAHRFALIDSMQMKKALETAQNRAEASRTPEKKYLKAQFFRPGSSSSLPACCNTKPESSGVLPS